MRRSSFTGVASGGGPGEPLIVVEESGGIAEEDEEDESKGSSPCDSPTVNQYLLTPYRDLRKRSLPTPPCTSGITASQVRRLSERGGEGSGPSPIEQAFLATLSQAPAPQPGARRHSVVTISRAPPPNTIFGRNRRESIAAFASGLPLRRDSGTFQHRGSISSQCGSQSGSSFNLQLDIMDDIADAKQKAKEKRKVSWTPAPALDEIQKEPPKTPRRRASELPSLTFSPAGIVCTNNDLINLLSPITTSASEVGSVVEKEIPHITVNPNTGSPTQQKTIIDKKRKFLKDRSNSFDISALPGATSNWFTRRHQPSIKNKDEEKNIIVTFMDEKLKSFIAPSTSSSSSSEKPTSPKTNKVLWDDRSGSVIDPHIIGSAIEVFLNRRSSQSGESPKHSPTKPPKNPKAPWLVPAKEEEIDTTPQPCQSSFCSTLKDLFVK